MPGFFLEINSSHGEENIVKKDNSITNQIRSEKYYVRRTTVNKFMNDKVFFENESYLIIIEGIILNKKKLLKNNAEELSWADYIIVLYEKFGDEFFGNFSGSFSGVFYDKKKNKWLIFVDQIGSRQLYYTVNRNQLVISSEIKWITNYLRQTNQSFSIDSDGASLLLTYGYLLEDITLIKEIKKLNAGLYLLISEGRVQKKQYFLLDNTSDIETTEADFIRQIDELFLDAVQAEFNKNSEYNYDNYLTLSGGLDSRMTLFAAKKLGYKDIINITFAQSGSLDTIIAQQISDDLKCEWIFKSLDNGLFLFNIDDITRINGGIALNYGHLHQYSTYRLLDKTKIGVLHTGQLGDVVCGTFYNKPKDNDTFEIGDGAYSKKNLHLIRELKLKYNYKNQEIFNFYNRGFTGANSGLIVAQEFSEPFSPFFEVEFLKKALSIPVNLKFDHKFYFKWILKMHPNAAKYKWEKTNNLICARRFSVFDKSFYPNNIPAIIKRKLIRSQRENALKSKYKSMNPLDFYYQTNHLLEKCWTEYFYSNINYLPEELKGVAENMYKSGCALEKNMVISLVSALKLYFCEYV